ncbi:MAG: DNA cytosine methyltransferase [Acidimicrobiales bacterium]
MVSARFTFIDLFAGIGGFHAALTAMGGKCVYAVEIDPAAAMVYERNWGLNPVGDITIDASDDSMNVPEHDVLCAGFPCQPFSKSGAQRGMDETRGTLYWNILRIIDERKPAVVLLENVRNLAGPRHLHEWQLIVETLRERGYRVSETPAIFSPHLLPREMGGRPQVRERVFITASRLPEGVGLSSQALPVTNNRPIAGWDPRTWDLESDLPLEDDTSEPGCELSESERLWIDAWDDFVQTMWEVRDGRRLPGFPLWADEWRNRTDLDPKRLKNEPKWKADYLIKNAEFYSANKKILDKWTRRWGVYTDAFPPSRRKFEWQAQDTPRLWDAVMHLRPSGIRAKAPSYLPALVAITQTSIIGSRDRRLSPREAARLQGLPDWFDFGPQRTASTYRQLGNGVSVGVVWHILRAHVRRDEDALKWTQPGLLKAALGAPDSPDGILAEMHAKGGKSPKRNSQS